MSRMILASLTAALILAAATRGTAQDGASGELNPLELFDQRIMPIFNSPQPSSCVQCHLSSVDLKDYILPSSEKTFASLRDQGLIDLDHPEKSKILTLISMGEKDLDRGAQLIHEKTRNAEYEAFAGWIRACCNDPSLRDMPPLSLSERAGPDTPDEVIRHARKSRVVDSFVRNVWSQRMRCFPCHTPHEIDTANPKQQAAMKTLNVLKETLDEKLVQRLDIFHETPEATLQYLIERSQATPEGELPLLNLAEPRKSLLVLKPMSKLPKKIGEKQFEAPSSAEPVSHLGGLKMHPDDQSYKSFVAWINDYANVVSGRYASVDELPADNWYASQLVLKLTDAPEAWPVGMPVQLFLHTWDEQGEAWGTEPIAFTQGTVTPRRMVNGALFMLAQKGAEKSGQLDPEHASLERGRYVVKVYADANHRLAEDPTLLLGEKEFRGQAELKRPRWREGFLHAETLSAKQLIQ